MDLDFAINHVHGLLENCFAAGLSPRHTHSLLIHLTARCDDSQRIQALASVCQDFKNGLNDEAAEFATTLFVIHING